MRNRFSYTIRKAWILALCGIILGAGEACQRKDCPALNGGYVDPPKWTAKQKHKKHKPGLFGKKEKLHGF
jgi:hypothetical protein